MTDTDDLDDILRDHALLRRADRICRDLEAEGHSAADIALILRRAVRIFDVRQRYR
jgi:hypothetical protein